MAFGISLGKNKTKQNQTTNSTTTEQGTQDTSTTQQQSQTGTTTGQTVTSGSQSGTTSQRDDSTQTSTVSGSGTQQQSSSLFSDAILSQLESTVADSLSRANVSAGRVDGFDSNAFIEGGFAAAESRANAELEADINGLVSGLGGTSSGNTMAALIANRLRGDSAANLAGVRSGLTAQANEIARQNVAANNQALGVDQGFAQQLLANLKGGQAVTTGATTTDQTTTNQNSGISQQNTSQQNQQIQDVSQQTTQDLVSIINQLIATNVTKTGTENVNLSTSKKGGGIGLSI